MLSTIHALGAIASGYLTTESQRNSIDKELRAHTS